MSAPAIEDPKQFTAGCASLIIAHDRNIWRNGARVWRREIAGVTILASASNKFACQEHHDLGDRFGKQFCASVRGSRPLKRRMQDDALRPLYAR
jgi:hypothetical protein